jgi:hypothetical protein
VLAQLDKASKLFKVGVRLECEKLQMFELAFCNFYVLNLLIKFIKIRINAVKFILNLYIIQDNIHLVVLWPDFIKLFKVVIYKF